MLAALTVVGIGVAALVGWVFRWDTLIRIVPTFISMNPMTAVALILAGTSLALSLQQFVVARAAALAVMLIGLLRTSGVFGGWDLHLDDWLFAAAAPVPMAANTAVNLILIGGALLCVGSTRRAVRASVEWAAVVVGLGALLAILAYAYGVQSFFQVGSFTPMAFHTGVSFALLAVGVLFSHTDRGLLAVFVSRSAGGTVARRLLPAAILVPAILGWLMRQAQARGLFRDDFGDALVALATVAGFAFLVSWSAKELSGAEAAAIESRRFLQSTLDALSAHIAILDEHGTIVEVNDAWENFARGNRGDANVLGVGANYLAACDTATGASAHEATAAARGIRDVMARALDAFSLEYPCHSPDERRWFVMRVTRFSGPDPVRVVIVHIDITERRLTENALRASDEKFHQLADHITDVFWIRSPDLHEVQYVSPAFATIWGRPVESLYAHPHQWSEFIVPEDRARVRQAFDALTTDAGRVDIEYRIMRPDGEIRWVHVRGFQVRGATRELLRHVGIVTDITEKKQSDSARVASDERFRNFFELGLIGMAISSPDKAVLAANDRLCEILGYTRTELLQLRWPAFTHPEDLADEIPRFEALLDGSSEGYSMDKRYIHKDGHLIYAAISVRCVRRPDRSIDYLLAFAQDVTDRRKLELQLFQAQKLETVGRLAGGIAHEFNSVLTAIIGHSEALTTALPADGSLARHAREIGQAADRAAALTRQLLAHGRKQLLRPERLDLNAVLARADSGLRHVAGRGTSVRVVGAPGLGTVRADEGQIEQVIMNMAMNAADAMPNGGTLTLHTSNLVVDDEQASRIPDLTAGAYVVLDITDTGVGMSPQVKSHLFEPFFTTKSVGQGTGLGLSTCYGIIRQSGGLISVQSELGQGTTFRIYLPEAAAADVPTVERLDSPDMPRGVETILLVESDAALRDVAATLLRRLGYTVQAAADDHEAENISARSGGERVDLVFREGVRSFPPAALARRIRQLLDAGGTAT